MHIRSIQLRSRPLESPGAAWWPRWSALLRDRDRPSVQNHKILTALEKLERARADAVREALLDEQLRGPGRRRF